MKLDKSNKVLNLSNKLLPGGSTFNKTNFFDQRKTPYCLKSGNGSKVKDLDNNVYIDFMNGLGCNLLGYNVSFINKAINKEIDNGVLLPISNELEVEVAKKLINLIPSAEAV